MAYLLLRRLRKVRNILRTLRTCYALASIQQMKDI
jgi:hypothetical protein